MVKTCLEVMDYHHSIFLIKRLSPSGTSRTGDFIPEVNEYAPIAGHWEDMTYEMISRAPEGIYNVGDRMFYSDVNLSPQDKLMMEELDGGSTKWEVVGRNQKLPYWDKIGVRRSSYHLKQIQIDEPLPVLTPSPAPEIPLDQKYTDPVAIPPAPHPDPAPPESIDEPVPETPADTWTPSWMEE